jgi:hypothetical protein
LVVFIEFSASTLVLKDELPIMVVVVVVGFCWTIVHFLQREQTPRRRAMVKTIACGIVLGALATSVLAADEYWIVQDSSEQ